MLSCWDRRKLAAEPRRGAVRPVAPLRVRSRQAIVAPASGADRCACVAIADMPGARRKSEGRAGAAAAQRA